MPLTKLKMPKTKINKKFLIAGLLASNCLLANEYFDEKILQDNRVEIFNLQKEQAIEDSSKLKKDWINPIIFKYKKEYGSDDEFETTSISVDQPIFKSGGIYQAIKYANSSFDYANLDIDQQKKELIKTALNLLFNIHKINLNIQKSELLVKNAQIDVQRKKEQVLNGFLDSSYLDNALLTLNDTKISLADLKYQKKQLENSFDNLSSKKYTELELPKFKLFSQEEYLKDNFEILKAQSLIEKNYNFKNMTIAKYLPTFSAYYTHANIHSKENGLSALGANTTNYGLYVSMPLDIRTFNDIQSNKIEYLKSKLSLKNKISDETATYKSAFEKVSMIEEKISIINEDLKVYDSILEVMMQEKEAQIKTQSDYDTLKNSSEIKKLDVKTYELDKQIELLELYTKLAK